MRLTHKQTADRCISQSVWTEVVIPSSVFIRWTLQFISLHSDSLLSFREDSESFSSLWNVRASLGVFHDSVFFFARRLLSDPQAGRQADRRTLPLSHLVTICQLSAFRCTRRTQRRMAPCHKGRRSAKPPSPRAADGVRETRAAG